MAIYHFHVTQISRGKGQSVVAAAAYRAGEILHDNYYGEDHDYTKKGGVVLTEIFLPEHVPIEYGDREFLWNAVENAEANPRAQLAYSFDFALPNELGETDNYEITKRFVMENFVPRGMICDVAIHKPSKAPGDIENPHVHVLVPMRSMSEDGRWNAKQRREYVLDENGKRIRDEKGKYVFKAVKTNDWGEISTLEEWRRNWALVVNDALEKNGIAERIDYRSNSERGMDELPTVHEGVAVRAMEKKGIKTDKGEWNRYIRSINNAVRELIHLIKQIKNEISEMIEEEKKLKEQNKEFGNSVQAYIDKIEKKYYGVVKPKKIAEVIFFIQTHEIHSLEDFRNVVSAQYGRVTDIRTDIRELEASKKAIEEIVKRYDQYNKTRPVYMKWKSIKSKEKRIEFEEAHQAEMKMFHMANRILSEKYPDKKIPIRALNNELSKLTKEIKCMYDELKIAKAEADKAFRLKCCIEDEQRKEKRKMEQSL